jgi:hypothetical protein
MTVNGNTRADGTSDNYNGLGKTAAELQVASGFPEVFTQSPWTYEPGKLPGLFGTTVDMPWHLKPDLVTIASTAKFEETLTVNTSGLNAAIEHGTLSYQWIYEELYTDGVTYSEYIDNATSATYTIKGSDIGKTIRVIVFAENYEGGVASNLATIGKADAAAPTLSVSNDTITIADLGYYGVEYKLQGATEYTLTGSNIITGLPAGTYLVRHPETYTHFASADAIAVIDEPSNDGDGGKGDGEDDGKDGGKGKDKDNSPILANHSPLPTSHSPTYYNLKGKPLGTQKPTAPGVYIEKSGKNFRRVVVR